MVSYAMRTYLESKGVRTLAEMHPSFANMDVARTLLEKRRALWYPDKTHLNGVLFEFERRHLFAPDKV